MPGFFATTKKVDEAVVKPIVYLGCSQQVVNNLVKTARFVFTSVSVFVFIETSFAPNAVLSGALFRFVL